MFTGIIETLGRIEAIEFNDEGTAARLVVHAGELVDDLPTGGSLAVNGVCLTALPLENGTTGTFDSDVMGETLDRTTLGALRPGDTVNLERCVRADGRLDGHVVQGHVDGVGTIASIVDEGNWTTLRVTIPPGLVGYTVEKGSIALDGTSLTLSAVADPTASEPWVEVGLIPSTLAATRFGTAEVGDTVNIEVDVLAKYVARQLVIREGGQK